MFFMEKTLNQAYPLINMISVTCPHLFNPILFMSFRRPWLKLISFDTTFVKCPHPINPSHSSPSGSLIRAHQMVFHHLMDSIVSGGRVELAFPSRYRKNWWKFVKRMWNNNIFFHLLVRSKWWNSLREGNKNVFSWKRV